MSYAHDTSKPKAAGARGRLIWPTLLLAGLVLGIGCGARDSRVIGNEFVKGVRPASDNSARLLRNAHYFTLMGQPELGLKELETAHRQDPGNLSLANVLAQYYDEMGMCGRAQQIYQEVLALEPDNPVLENNLCFSSYLAGNWGQAETCFRKTLTRQPHNQAARNNLGLLLCRQGRQEEAKRLWQETEGEVAAAQKLGEVLAALSLTVEPLQAQQPRSAPPVQATRPHPPALPAAVQPKTREARPQPDLNPLPVARKPVEPALSATAPPAPDPAKLAAAAPQPGRGTPSRKIPAPKAAEDRMVAAKPNLSVTPSESTVDLARPRSEITAGSISAPAAPVPERPKDGPLRPLPNSTFTPQQAVAEVKPEKSQGTRVQPITSKELIETNIAVINGNGTPDLARDTRSRLSLEGFNVVTIANYQDFGVDHTTIYYRPEAKRLAAALNTKFFPGAEIEATARLAEKIDVKVILGRDLLPQQQAAGPQAASQKSL
jgi:hypothetical protein